MMMTADERKTSPCSTGLYGLFDFICQTVKMIVQLGVRRALDGVGCEVSDQGSLGRVITKFFD
jgi:hypothetical protein